VGKKCNLHIRAASIFFVQPELLEVQRFRALYHKRGPILNEEADLATAHHTVLTLCGFRVCRRTRDAISHANTRRRSSRAGQQMSCQEPPWLSRCAISAPM